MAKKRFETLLHLYRQRRYQSTITLQCFWRCCIALKILRQKEQAYRKEITEKHKAARTIQKLVRKKAAMSYFKFWQEMANEAAGVINSRFARSALARLR